VSTVVLAPGQLAIEQTHVDRRHIRSAQTLRAQQLEQRPGGNGSHEAALLIEPFCVALFRHAIADEGGARRAQRDQLVSVHR